jgi:hypothetical protein
VHPAGRPAALLAALLRPAVRNALLPAVVDSWLSMFLPVCRDASGSASKLLKIRGVS